MSSAIPPSSPRRPTRERILATAADQFAARGFLAVSIEDLGASAGVTGPALYRHFSSKQDILGCLLVGISERLLAGAEEVLATCASPEATLRGLIARHAEFAVSEPELIRIHTRELTNLTSHDEKRVRQLQRRYVELWALRLQQRMPALSLPDAVVRVHATFGLLNSTPHIPRTGAKTAKRVLQTMALAALEATESEP